MRLELLALGVGAWAALAVLGFCLVIALFLGFGMIARRAEEAGLARRYGWAEAAELYTSTAPLDDERWVPHQALTMTKRRGEARETSWWTRYENCDTQVTADGFALRYRGRLRPNSLPAEHPVLFFPWSALGRGERGDLKGDGRRGTVTTFSLVELPHVALAFQDHNADQIAAASGGQWSITPAPPKPRL